ncbi:hypothetical protein FAGKG844_10314 [Frankia sp. AgKG'84/4]
MSTAWSGAASTHPLKGRNGIDPQCGYSTGPGSTSRGGDRVGEVPSSKRDGRRFGDATPKDRAAGVLSAFPSTEGIPMWLLPGKAGPRGRATPPDAGRVRRRTRGAAPRRWGRPGRPWRRARGRLGADRGGAGRTRPGRDLLARGALVAAGRDLRVDRLGRADHHDCPAVGAPRDLPTRRRADRLTAEDSHGAPQKPLRRTFEELLERPFLIVAQLSTPSRSDTLASDPSVAHKAAVRVRGSETSAHPRRLSPGGIRIESCASAG